jgi:hypothetical protein
LQLNLTNGSNAAVTLSNLTLTDAGSGNTANITGVTVEINGTQAGSPALFSTNPLTLNLGSYVLPPNTQTMQILLSFSGSASGSYQLSIGAMSGTSANNGGQAAAFTGIPSTGGYSVVVQAPTPTQTLSPTPSFTPTATVSPTPTSSQTPVPQKFPVIYPNPVDGTAPVNVRPPFFTGVSDVKVQIFTLAYRKVQEHTYKNLVVGQDCPIKLVDEHNDLLANGLYYVVVTTNAGRTIGKMLVLR